MPKFIIAKVEKKPDYGDQFARQKPTVTAKIDLTDDALNQIIAHMPIVYIDDGVKLPLEEVRKYLKAGIESLFKSV